MSIARAFRDAWRTVMEQKGETLKLLASEAAITLACLAPLLFLTEEAPLKYLAALSLPLWLLVKVPARLNAAAAMQDGLGDGKVFSLRLADPGNYWKKVLYGLVRLAFLALWGAPLAAALVYAYDQYSGSTDGFTVMQSIYRLGGNDTKTGVIILILIFLGLLLFLALGAGFHSVDRHLWALDRKPKGKSVRCRLYGLLCRICSVAFLAPLLIAVVIAAWRYVPLLNDVSGVLTGDVPKPSTRTTLIILGIGGALTVPLLPLRSMVTAAYVHGSMRE